MVTFMANDRKARRHETWAVVPIKEFVLAKQRLANFLPPRLRQELALAMFEDVLEALAATPQLSGIAVVTLDQSATRIALRWGAEVWTDGGRDGHTGAVTAAARRLATKTSTMLTIPGDVPLVSPGDVARVLTAHPSAPAFTIVPAWDEGGSNSIICSPADAVPLRFGPDSFFPHLAAARAHGLEPNVVRNRAISLDIDEPPELVKFMNSSSETRSWALLDRSRAQWERMCPVIPEVQ
jgi:2-phospho-L-lactate/phosphoenolpyruvate guanylyltransferase